MRTTGRKLSLSLLFYILFVFQFASAQEDNEVLSLTLRKNFGFGMGVRIQGSFTLLASGPSDLQIVDFIIDEIVVFHDPEFPFEYRFHTADYEPGTHNIKAIGVTKTESKLQSQVLQREFISPDQGLKSAADVIIPLFIVIVIIVTIGIAATSLITRKNGFRIGEYGVSGGAVCSRCGLPFSRHAFSPNLVFGKLERCPHCRKWRLVRRATQAELADAEARFRAESQRGRIEPKDEKSRWQDLIEESRFEND